MRLFRAPWSTNVERVTLALAHKGLAGLMDRIRRVGARLGSYESGVRTF